ncbi:MAG: helix-turn-helix transcriptional regulator [Verrucomicrobiota bacterium]
MSVSAKPLHLIWLVEIEPAGSTGFFEICPKEMCRGIDRMDLSTALKLLMKKKNPLMIFLEGPPGKPMQNALARIHEIRPALPVFTISRWQNVSEMRSWFTGYFMEISRTTPPNPPKSASAYGLSARELDILRLMVKGLIKKEIAEQLSISHHTVDNHERHIFTKMNVHTRTAVVAKALIEKLF